MKLYGNYIILVPTLVFPVTVITTYTLAVTSKHLTPIWPYISHTGDFPIESCFFSLGFNIIGAFYTFISFIRYYQIKELSGNSERKQMINIINQMSLPLGMIASITIALIGSVQEVNLRWVHFFSAMACTLSSLAYFCMQTVISYCVNEFKGLRAKFRLALNAISITCHLSAPGLWFDIIINYPRSQEKMLWWMSYQPGYYQYILGAFTEWIVTITNNLYVASFYTEFKKVRICKDEILFL